MKYVLEPPPQASVAVSGSDARFPVRRIFCVGRNYAAHAREMGADDREPPFFFCKPADAVVDSGARLPWPLACTELHHEGELVVALGRGGTAVPASKAPALIWGYAAGIDLTRRDLQARAKQARRPWDMAKGFDRSAPCGALLAARDWARAPRARLALSVNGAARQQAPLAQMIWPVNDIIAHLSRLVTLAPGDLIYTGTPAGVGPLAPGDRVQVTIDGLPPLEISLEEKAV